jgi:hypothetical protein
MPRSTKREDSDGFAAAVSVVLRVSSIEIEADGEDDRKYDRNRQYLAIPPRLR